MIKKWESYIAYTDEFTRYLHLATALHFAVVLFALLIQLLGGLKFLHRDNLTTTNVKSSVRVDIVAMPKFTVKELKKMKLLPTDNQEEQSAKKVVEKPEVVKENEPSFKKVDKERKKVDLSSLLNNISSKNVKVDKRPKRGDKTKSKIDSDKLKKLVLEGNKISKGGSLIGNEWEQELGEFQSYIENLPNLIRPHWKLPSYLIESELKCRVRIFISRNGELIKSEIYESSGAAEYDGLALKAVKNAAPFPEPERTIVSKLVGGDVILGFPL